MDIESYALLSNSIVTLACGIYPIVSIHYGKLRRHPFYILTSLGMLVYGSEILLRYLGLQFTSIIYFMISLAYVLYTLGLWTISKNNRIMIYIIISYSISLLILIINFFVTFYNNIFFNISAILITLPLIITLIYHRAILGKISDKFQFGWYLLLFTNFILYGKGWISDLFAIFSKVMILMGMFDHEFFLLSKKLHESKIIPIDSTYKDEGKIHIIHLSVNEKWKTIEKVRELINANLKNDIHAYIFSFQGVTPYIELWRLKWIDPEKIHILLFSSNSEKASREFDLTPMDMTMIRAMLTAVTKIRGSTVIFMNLSHLVQIFGVGSVYKMISDKLGAIRDEKIDFYAFLFPETHSDKSVIKLFKQLSDE